ncbi:MAG: SRPBCC family protein [Hyphomicrobium sp.]|jgi:hypothetical protein|nr:SRPBCC family protein [Hyphomicrobium sp.]
MLKRLALTIALLVLAPAVASAHGPSRQKVVTTIEINAPLDKVWAVVGNFQDMSWHPAIKKTEGSGGNDVNATRKLTLQSGGIIDETLLKYNAETKSLSYEITKVDVKDFPVANYSSTISAHEEGGKTIVEWKGAFYRGYVNNDPPPELNDEAAIKAVNNLHDTGLAALKAKLEGG